MASEVPERSEVVSRKDAATRTKVSLSESERERERDDDDDERECIAIHERSSKDILSNTGL